MGTFVIVIHALLLLSLTDSRVPVSKPTQVFSIDHKTALLW